jgi:hypothetical protein
MLVFSSTCHPKMGWLTGADTHTKNQERRSPARLPKTAPAVQGLYAPYVSYVKQLMANLK